MLKIWKTCVIFLLIIPTLKAQDQIVKGTVNNFVASMTDARASLSTSEGLKVSEINAQGEFQFILSATTTFEVNTSSFTISPVRKYAIVNLAYASAEKRITVSLEEVQNEQNTQDIIINPATTEDPNKASTPEEPPQEIQEENDSISEESFHEDIDSLVHTPNQDPDPGKLTTLRKGVTRLTNETITIKEEINNLKNLLDSPDLSPEEKNELRKRFEELQSKLSNNISLLREVQEEIDKILGKYVIPPALFYSLLIGFLALIVVSIFYFLIARFRRLDKEKVLKLNGELEETIQKLKGSEEELQAKIEKINQQREELEAQKDKLALSATQLEELLEETQSQKEDLTQKNTKLEEIQKIKDLLISAVNHDLRNPLNPIVNYSSPDYPDDDLKRLMHRIHVKSKRMFVMIEDIMDVYSAKRIVLKPEKADLHRATSEAIEQLIDFQEAMPEIVNTVAPNSQGYFSYKYIVRVLENFLSNAIKYTPKTGKITFFTEDITYTFANQTEAQQATKLTIQDTGEGIPKDQLDNIFLPFVNPNAKGIGVAKSVGLGLAFCKMIIEMHHSQIEVNSELGKGTSFSFILPKPETQDTTADQGIPTAYTLRDAEREYLVPFVQKMQGYKIYDLEMGDILESIQTENMPGVASWKMVIKESITNFDLASYNNAIQKVIS